MRWRRLFAAVPLAALTLAGPAAEPALAQFTGYFGRNKVQYETFEFQVLETEHFDVYFYEEGREAAQMVGRMAERWYARLSRVLNHEFRQRQPIILYANHPHFEQTNATPGQIDEATGGFTEILKRRVVLPLAGGLAETDHVLGHELVHAFQFDMTGQGTSGGQLDIPGAIRLPLWFIEGMAEYLSLGPIDPFTTMWLRDAVANDELPTIADLRHRRYFPYRYGHALWSFIAGRWGEQRIGRILKLAGRSGNPVGALAAVLEISPEELSAMWHEELREYYGPVLASTREADDFGRKVLHEEETGGRLNLGPSLSPDGSQVVFLSERGLLGIDMFLADARTGEVRSRITSSALDPHFESLQFISSSGSWSPDGRRFAFAGVTRGQPVVRIIELPSGDRVREHRFRELGEIFGPVWSPDGGRIAFTAQVEGFLDLYLMDVETGELTRLTRDPYANFQPSWSPDGRSLVFATDRFDTDLSLITVGRYRLARMDLEDPDRAIVELPAPPDGSSWDPHWAPGGDDIFFVSDHGGIRNVHRLNLPEARIYQVTDLQTGVSGISALSPSLSVAAGTGELAVSMYQNGPFNFEVYILDSPEVLRGEPISPVVAEVDPAVIPPRERVSDELIALLRNPRLGLADPITFEERDYSAALGLDFIGQPNLAFGASDFGVFFAGGGSLFFSDMLGNRNLFTLLQVNSTFGGVANGTAALVGYENRSSRWNWGMLGGQIPFVTRSFRTSVVESGGEPLLLVEDFRRIQVDRQVAAGFAYPINRAQRVEFGVRASLVDFVFEQRLVAINRFNQIVFDQKESVPSCQSEEEFLDLEVFCSPSSIFLGTGSAALVFDNSIWGGTSPVLGQRYRLEAAPTGGTLNFLNLLADYRRYVPLAFPLNLAGRLLHFGRYFPDGEDPRLSPLFVGWPQLVRGYDFNSFRREECPTLGACPVFDQLVGSKIGVANVELRLPFLGGVGVIPAPGFPPIEVGAFFDAGVAWTNDLGPCFSSSGPDDCREPVKSVGFLTRINLFGFLIGEIDVVNPLDRPEKGWFVQFNLMAGF